MNLGLIQKYRFIAEKQTLLVEVTFQKLLAYHMAGVEDFSSDKKFLNSSLQINVFY